MTLTEKRKYRVAMVQGIFPFYRDEIFSKLNEIYDFKLFHSSLDNGIPQIERDYSSKHDCIIFFRMKYILFSVSILKFNPDVIIHEFSLSLLNMYLCYLFCRLSGCKFILWGHGYNRKKGFYPQNNFLDKVRLYFINRCDALILYSDDIKNEIARITHRDGVFVARNSIQTDKKDNLYKSLVKAGRSKIRDDVFKHNGINICFVSRLTPVKKVILLCELAERIKKIGKRVTIHVLGDGEDFSKLKDAIYQKSLENEFKLYGSIYDEDIVSKIIFASDFHVVPAWLGLTINLSFCYGTPVATLKNEKHPPEMQFAKDGMNSIVANTVTELSERIIEVIEDSHIHLSMREHSRNFFEQILGIESMLSGFIKAIKYSFSKTKR